MFNIKEEGDFEAERSVEGEIEKTRGGPRRATFALVLPRFFPTRPLFPLVPSY